MPIMVVGTKEPATNYAQRIGDVHTYGGHCCFITILNDMNVTKNEAGTLLPMTVTEGVTVNVLPHGQHEYLMTTKEVAIGYGTSKYSIFQAVNNHPDELIEGKHFVRGVDILYTPSLKGFIQPNSILLTKRGIVRLGFFIKSKQAKVFRDWAEELIIDLSLNPSPQARDLKAMAKALPTKAKHNRLTSDRLIGILADVCRIDDKALRLSITEKLMGKEAQHGSI